MKLEGVVGPQTLTDGSDSELRLDKLGALVATELHGKYYEQSFRGNVFHACSDTGVLLPAVAATANNVFTLANPAGSGKNLALISFDMVVTTINATAATGGYALMVNTNTVAAAVSGTALTALSAMIGTTTSAVARAFRTSTIPAAPTIFWPFGYKETGGVVTALPISGVSSFHVDFDGLAILTPGTAITPQIVGTADTTNATVICAMRWEEISI